MTKINLYLARHYCFNVLSFTLIVLSIIYLFDVLEILRRLNDDETNLGHVMMMGLFKLPEVGQIILPFAVLFSAIFTFWQLNRRQELVVLRSTGLSVWQFLKPIGLVAVFIGVLQILIINPFGAFLLTQYEDMEQKYLSRTDNLVATLKEGLWLRQNRGEGEVIIYSQKINPENWTFENVTFYNFDRDTDFAGRIDAPEARLTKKGWLFPEAVIHERRQNATAVKDYLSPTDLTPEDVENSFASPETRSFWEIPGLIAHLREAGFDTTRLRIHFHSLLAIPVLFLAMVCVAASIALKPSQRSGGTLRMIITGIFTGFLIFFMMNFLKAMGASGQLPVLMAAWSPACIVLLFGLGFLLQTEDG